MSEGTKEKEPRTEERARNQCGVQQEMRKYRWKGCGRAKGSASSKQEKRGTTRKKWRTED